jgi:EmrB/QacA subfamily drug resistance transporter
MSDGAGAPTGVPVPDGAPGLRMASGAGRWVLIATVLGSTLTAIDSTVVGIALPAIGRNFTMPVSSLQWVVSAYLLSLAGLLLVGGALGDHYGRRRIFVIGVVWFAVASLLCALAPDPTVLIAARALQGAGGALLAPGSLAILQASFAAEDRSRAIGAWSGFGGLGTAIGPFLGGFLISAVSWRLIFLINLPLAVVVVLVAVRHVPETRDPGARGRIDVVGALLVTAGLGLLTAGLIEAPGHGWTSPTTLVLLVGGAALLGAFLVAEEKGHSPMLPLDVFRSLQFSATNAVTFVVYAALGGALFLLPVELQQVSHYSPLEAGTSLLPLTALMLVLSSRSGALAARIGPRLQMGVGPIVVGVGMVLLRLAGSGGDYLTAVLPGVLVLGVGLAITVAPLTATALSAAPVERAGVASAVNNDVARAGGLIAVALIPALAGLGGHSYLHPALFAMGFRRAMVIAAVAAAFGGCLAAALVHNPHPWRRGPEIAPPVAPPCCPLEATPLHHPVPAYAGRSASVSGAAPN